MTWKGLRHPNVLPLLGVTMTKHRFEMVSEWMVNGSINVFVKEHPDADRLKLVCLLLRSLFPLAADSHMIAIAERRH